MTRNHLFITATLLSLAGVLVLGAPAWAGCGSCGHEASAEAKAPARKTDACTADQAACAEAVCTCHEDKTTCKKCPAKAVAAKAPSTQPACSAECKTDKLACPPCAGKLLDLTLHDQHGKKINPADYHGKVLVLEWTNWQCPFIKRHYQDKTTQALADKYRDQGVVWLAVNSTKSHDVAFNKKHAAKYGITYPVLDDHTGKFGRRFEAKTTPHLFVFDDTGAVVYRGALDDDPRGNQGERRNYVAQALDAVLADKDVPTPKTKPYGCSVKYAPVEQASAR